MVRTPRTTSRCASSPLQNWISWRVALLPRDRWPLHCAIYGGPRVLDRLSRRVRRRCLRRRRRRWSGGSSCSDMTAAAVAVPAAAAAAAAAAAGGTAAARRGSSATQCVTQYCALRARGTSTHGNSPARHRAHMSGVACARWSDGQRVRARVRRAAIDTRDERHVRAALPAAHRLAARTDMSGVLDGQRARARMRRAAISTRETSWVGGCAPRRRGRARPHAAAASTHGTCACALSARRCVRAVCYARCALATRAARANRAHRKCTESRLFTPRRETERKSSFSPSFSGNLEF